MSAAQKIYAVCALVCAVALAGCQRTPDETRHSAAETPAKEEVSSAITDDQRLPAELQTLPTGYENLPYPVYPNATKYSAGDENGLEVVLFQTSDGFETVDNFYRRLASDNGMPRLAAMKDYVRYTVSTDETDPWETSTPGIVIHSFNNDSERAAVGADTEAVTNIIMSF